MMVLYDEEEIMRSYVESERHEATHKANIETARRLLEDGTLPIDKIAKFSNLPMETVRRLADTL